MPTVIPAAIQEILQFGIPDPVRTIPLETHVPQHETRAIRQPEAIQQETAVILPHQVEAVPAPLEVQVAVDVPTVVAEAAAVEEVAVKIFLINTFCNFKL